MKIINSIIRLCIISANLIYHLLGCQIGNNLSKYIHIKATNIGAIILLKKTDIKFRNLYFHVKRNVK